MRPSLDAGVNFIDTANVYSQGESETLLGGALKTLGRPRDQLVVATKVRGSMGPGVNQVGLSRGHILSSIDASLKRLGLEYVDLYQIHGVDPATPLDETLRALDAVVRSGKARYVGFSNLPAWLASKALTYAADHPPPGYSDWTSIAKAGAAKAKTGDVEAAKASCKQCHDLYKESYKAAMRDRPF